MSIVIKEVHDEDFNDIVDIVSMGTRMHKESIYQNISWNSTKVLDLAARVASSPMGLLLIAYDDSDGTPVGFFGAMINEHWASDDLVAHDFALYVVPENRGSRLGLNMIKMYNQWANANGAKIAMLGASTGIDGDRVSKLFEHVGFNNIGGLYYTLH